MSNREKLKLPKAKPQEHLSSDQRRGERAKGKKNKPKVDFVKAGFEVEQRERQEENKDDTFERDDDNPLRKKYKDILSSPNKEKEETPLAKLLKRPSEKTELMNRMVNDVPVQRRGSVRKNMKVNPLISDNLGQFDSIFMPNNRLDRIKSNAPMRDMEFDDFSSEYSDPEVKRLKRKAVIC